MTIPGRVGIVLRDPLPWEQSLQVVETAEETGYEAVFVPEIAARESFATLTGFVGSTSRIGLGTGLVTIGSRDMATTAMAAATVQDLSEGRMVLGLGTGDPGALKRFRIEGADSIEVMRRYAGAIRQILAGEEVEPDPVLGNRRFHLELPLKQPPPVWLGALGDRMVALAAEGADGVLLNWCTPARVQDARRIIDGVRGASGSNGGSFTLAVYVRACLGVRRDVALGALKPMTAQYAWLPHYRRQMERMGLAEEASIAARALKAGRYQDVPDALVDALAVTGGRTEVTARFDQFFRAGADLVFCYPVAALEPFSSVLRTLLAAAPAPAVER
jgi:alkanesulfonate monooxygenase SsuD/methylene tetrahydromethanopterin reductase-like flavin-dependent oxidoreductase (luciferase family)